MKMTSTKVLWITIWFELSDIKESLSLTGFLFKENNDYLTFYTWSYRMH